MKTILVDSNILIDIFNTQSHWHDWSKDKLRHYGNKAILVINPVIYAEVSLCFDDEKKFDTALPCSLLRREPLPWEAAFLAARAFLDYRKAGGIKTSVMPDFFIGAHAVVQQMQLITRDVKRYKTYFPSLGIIHPDG